MSRQAIAPVRVGIVILHWNRYEATRRLLHSLGDRAPDSHTIYLVDNGSTDGSMERLETEIAAPSIVLLRNGRNLGFAAGCNPGIRRALADGCTDVLLVNNDCVIDDPAFLAPALELAATDPRIGIVGGKLLRWPDTGTIWSTGGEIHFFGERYIGLDEPDRGQYDSIADREFVSGALMLIRRPVLDEIGLLPEAYFFGHEDWEYSLRARRAGFRLVYHPGFRAFHEAGHSHEPASPVYLYNDTLGKILFKRRNLGAPAFFVWRSLYALYLTAGLPLRAWWRRRRPLGGTHPGLLGRVMRRALRDARGMDRITLETLESFRNDPVT